MKTVFVTAFWLAVCVVGACAPVGNPGQEPELTGSLRQYVQGYVANGDFSGLVAVSGAASDTRLESFGFADFEAGTPFSRDSSFHIASVSKTFTAAVIKQLREKGQLALSDEVARYLPDFPNADRITIENLLTHSSGIADYWSLPGADERAQRPIDMQELLSWLGGFPLQFEPGTANQYSNSGYALLAAIIEQIAQQDYHEVVRQLLSDKLGPNQVSFFQGDATVAGYQPAHSESGLARYQSYDSSILVGAGSLKSTATDLLKWCELFVADFNNAVSAPFLYGWGAREEDGLRWAQQTGRTPGYAAHVRAYPDSGTCIVVLSNIESEAVSEIGAGVASITFGGAAPVPTLRQPHTLTADEARAYEGFYDIAPGNRLQVTADGTFLSLKGQNGVFLPLEPIADDRFFFRQLNVEIVAQRDSSGLVDALLWGGSYPIPRVEEG